MDKFFYNFFNKPLGYELFNKDTEDGTPSPPSSQDIVSQTGEQIISQAGENIISNE